MSHRVSVYDVIHRERNVVRCQLRWRVRYLGPMPPPVTLAAGANIPIEGREAQVTILSRSGQGPGHRRGGRRAAPPRPRTDREGIRRELTIALAEVPEAVERLRMLGLVDSVRACSRPPGPRSCSTARSWPRSGSRPASRCAPPSLWRSTAARQLEGARGRIGLDRRDRRRQRRRRDRRGRLPAAPRGTTSSPPPTPGAPHSSPVAGPPELPP